MVGFLGRGKLHNQKVIDVIRLLSRMMDMWLILLTFELMYLYSGSRMIGMMGIAFCMTLNYSIILLPQKLYLIFSRKVIITFFVFIRLVVVTVLLLRMALDFTFHIFVLNGLLISVVSGLSNGLVIMYRHPVKDEERKYNLERRLIYLTVPLVIGYSLYWYTSERLEQFVILSLIIMINFIVLMLIPFIKYNRTALQRKSTLEFTVDGLMMCAVEYMVRILFVLIVGFEISILVGIVMYIAVMVVVMSIAWLKDGAIESIERS